VSFLCVFFIIKKKKDQENRVVDACAHTHTRTFTKPLSAMVHACWFCGKIEAKLVCSRCHGARYCGRDCQAKDYVRGTYPHKEICSTHAALQKDVFRASNGMCSLALQSPYGLCVVAKEAVRKGGTVLDDVNARAFAMEDVFSLANLFCDVPNARHLPVSSAAGPMAVKTWSAVVQLVANHVLPGVPPALKTNLRVEHVCHLLLLCRHRIQSCAASFDKRLGALLDDLVSALSSGDFGRAAPDQEWEGCMDPFKRERAVMQRNGIRLVQGGGLTQALHCLSVPTALLRHSCDAANAHTFAYSMAPTGPYAYRVGMRTVAMRDIWKNQRVLVVTGGVHVGCLGAKNPSHTARLRELGGIPCTCSFDRDESVTALLSTLKWDVQQFMDLSLYDAVAPMCHGDIAEELKANVEARMQYAEKAWDATMGDDRTLLRELCAAASACVLGWAEAAKVILARRMAAIKAGR
jgi:hypothetical protein